MEKYNLTDLKPLYKEAVILGEGPSKEKLLNNTGFANNRAVACINRAGIKYPEFFEYWITYHAEWIARWWVDRELEDLQLPEKVIVSKVQHTTKIDHLPYVSVTKQVRGLNSGGTSSIFAAMVLLDMGYKPIHLFGVDLTKAYSKERKFWSILKGEPLIFHGEDWFHRNYFQEEEGW